jgi:quercetin dioxygenase-like cupin family protein
MMASQCCGDANLSAVASSANRVFTPTDYHESEYFVSSFLGYGGYRVRFMTPEGSQILANAAMCYPGQMKLIHSHPGRDSVLVLLEGEAEYLLGERESRRVAPGDALISPDGSFHGLRNIGNSRCLWVYLEGPLPLTMDLPNTELFFAAPKTENYVSPRQLPFDPAAVIGGVVDVVSDPADEKRASTGGERVRFGLPTELADRVLNQLDDRILCWRDIKDRVEVFEGYRTLLHAVDFGNQGIQSIIGTSELTGTMPMHRREGADFAMVLLEGRAEYSWSADGGETESTTLTPGMVARALDGEFHGLRSLDDPPAKYLYVENPVPTTGAPVVWLDEEPKQVRS